MSLTPYYEHGGITIYHGDCRDVLPQLGGIDSVVTDPPYGTGFYEHDTDVMTPELLLSLAEFGPCAVFGYPENLVRLCAAANKFPDEWITWWPTNGMCRGMNFKGLRRESEHVAVFGRATGWKTIRSARSNAGTRIGIAGYVRKKKHRYGITDDPEETRAAGDVWTDAAPGLAFNSKKRKHPNEKPVSLMAKLIQGIGGALVLDPFAGSGTTLRAAADLGVRAVGIEIDERHCETAANRLAQEMLFA